MSHAAGVRRRVRIEARRLAVVAIVDDRLITEDPGARDIFPGRVHQSGVGRMNVGDRLVPRRFIGLHAVASSASRARAAYDDCRPESTLAGEPAVDNVGKWKRQTEAAGAPLRLSKIRPIERTTTPARGREQVPSIRRRFDERTRAAHWLRTHVAHWTYWEGPGF